MKLRAAGDDDLETILVLALAFYAEDGFSTPEAVLRTNLKVLIASPAAHVCIATDTEVDGNGACGFAITTTSFGLENGLLAELEDLYVRPEARRRGIAELLIADAAEWARAQGSERLEIVIAPNGLDVEHLFRYYQRRGFQDQGRHLLSYRLT